MICYDEYKKRRLESLGVRAEPWVARVDEALAAGPALPFTFRFEPPDDGVDAGVVAYLQALYAAAGWNVKTGGRTHLLEFNETGVPTSHWKD